MLLHLRHMTGYRLHWDVGSYLHEAEMISVKN